MGYTPLLIGTVLHMILEGVEDTAATVTESPNLHETAEASKNVPLTITSVPPAAGPPSGAIESTLIASDTVNELLSFDHVTLSLEIASEATPVDNLGETHTTVVADTKLAG